MRRLTAGPRPPAAGARRQRRFIERWRRPAMWGTLGLTALVGLGVAGLVIAGQASSAGPRLVAWSASLGLAVAEIEVEGRSMTSPEMILRALEAQRGTPIFAVDPARAKAHLETLPWVKTASVERHLPDTLFVRLVEREPMALWQRQGKLSLIDRDGWAITSDRLDRFPGLIVVVGDDAPSHTAALLETIRSEPELAKRVTAAVRVGGRRWNVRLDNSIEIQLPEENPQGAWNQLAKLERTNKLLARDIEAVDMRLPDRLVVRTVPEPVKEPAKKPKTPAKNT